VSAPTAVTIDAYGTLVSLRDPVPALQEALRIQGAERSHDEVAAGFRAEVEHYRPRSHEGRDAETLAALRRESVRIFLDGARASELDVDEFVPAFLGALEFVALPGAAAACEELARHGVPAAVVSNWDIDLHAHLERLGFELPIVTSAEAGEPKPSPRIFELALERLGASAERAVHVGDSEDDAEGARAAGMLFEPAPLPTAVRRILSG
jgi:putative hydrolase of the HAD superfamily